jgi:hypothetical protein
MTTNQTSSNKNLVCGKKIGYEGKSIVTVDMSAYLPKTMEQNSRFWEQKLRPRNKSRRQKEQTKLYPRNKSRQPGKKNIVSKEQISSAKGTKIEPKEQISSTEGTNKTLSKEQILSTRGTRILPLRNKSRLQKEQKLHPRNKSC